MSDAESGNEVCVQILVLNIQCHGHVISDLFLLGPIRKRGSVSQSGVHFSHANANKSVFLCIKPVTPLDH